MIAGAITSPSGMCTSPPGLCEWLHAMTSAGKNRKPPPPRTLSANRFPTNHEGARCQPATKTPDGDCRGDHVSVSSSVHLPALAVSVNQMIASSRPAIEPTRSYPRRGEVDLNHWTKIGVAFANELTAAGRHSLEEFSEPRLLAAARLYTRGGLTGASGAIRRNRSHGFLAAMHWPLARRWSPTTSATSRVPVYRCELGTP